MTDHTTQSPQLEFQFTKLCECGCGQPLPRAKYPSEQRKFMSGHYNRSRASLADAFWARCTPGAPDECWPWMGAKNPKGYGRFCHPRSKVNSAHRVAYELHYGPIPKGVGFHGTCVLHKCDNPSCVNPEHLFLGTQKDNMKDRKEKGRENHNPPRGEAVGSAKITESQVHRIRLLGTQGISQAKIGRQFGISQTNVGRIIRREMWTHVP